MLRKCALRYIKAPCLYRSFQTNPKGTCAKCIVNQLPGCPMRKTFKYASLLYGNRYSRYSSSSNDKTPNYGRGVPQSPRGTIAENDSDHEPVKSIVVEMPKSKRNRGPKIDFSQMYYKNSYITPVRVMNEFMLKSSDLDTLPKYTRRSPYPEGGNVTVYLRTDVEMKCHEIWGGADKFQKAKQKRDNEERQKNRTQFFLKETLKEVRKETKLALSSGSPSPQSPVENVWKSGQGRVVIFAIGVNMANFAFKSVAWLYSGSHSMFSEAIHSLADTLNQLILAVGIHKSIQKPDLEHPYGYTNMRYVSSLISGVGIFCLGAGLSWYHGIQALLHAEVAGSLPWAIAILGGSLISEGSTLWIAINQARKSSKLQGLSLIQYVRNGYEPAVNVVLLEDLAAVTGVCIAATCMGISHYTGHPFADAVGSIMIGCLLGGVAAFIIHTNTQALVGRSILHEKKQQISAVLESDRLVRAIYDVKATDMGENLVRFKAEVDFDGKELTRIYFEDRDLDNLLAEMQNLKTIEEMEEFMMQYGAKVIDLLGAEVDRLEKKIMRKFPEVRHVDLEVL